MCNFAVVDLEMYRVPYGARKGKYRWASKTIQIRAVLLNETLEKSHEFGT